MTDKPKTLKDCYMSDGRNFEQRLREEAIKWVKSCEYRNRYGTICIKNNRCCACRRTMKMNDITEDDLKVVEDLQ